MLINNMIGLYRKFHILIRLNQLIYLIFHLSEPNKLYFKSYKFFN
jgi:hypothetical protein